MATETAIKQDFAVIATGGKQYIVSPGDVVNVELLTDRDLKEGDTVEFDEVLMKNTTVGTPTVSGAKVKAIYLKEAKGPKISIIRYKAKSNRDRKIGHRQKYAQVKIESI
jgi:large subunit ribosomal protein L21